MNENVIKKKIQEGLVQFSEHSLHKMDICNIDTKELINNMLNGEIIEDYPEDQRGHSCLFLSKDNKGYIHTVIGFAEENLFIIMIYRPTPPKFIDEKTRRVKK